MVPPLALLPEHTGAVGKGALAVESFLYSSLPIQVAGVVGEERLELSAEGVVGEEVELQVREFVARENMQFVMALVPLEEQYIFFRLLGHL